MSGFTSGLASVLEDAAPLEEPGAPPSEACRRRISCSVRTLMPTSRCSLPSAPVKRTRTIAMRECRVAARAVWVV